MIRLTTYDLKNFTENLKDALDLDLTEYSQAILRRRLETFLNKWNIADIDNLFIKLQNSPALVNKFIEHISVDTTEMFRDPGFWRYFNKSVIPHLAKNNKINILVPYITSDDELYTLLLLLDENQLVDRTQIIATSPFEINLLRTASGLYTNRKLYLAKENYKRYKQNEEADITKYFTIINSEGQFSTKLINKVKFIKTDLITSFLDEQDPFNLILFRNRMLYFNLNLQNKILEVLYYQLAKSGYLIIGYKENISKFVLYDKLHQIDKSEKIYIKKH